MPYTIVYMQGGTSPGSEIWTGALSEAREMADDAIRIGLYDRVEIFDDDDRLVSQHPRVLRPANGRGGPVDGDDQDG